MEPKWTWQRAVVASAAGFSVVVFWPEQGDPSKELLAFPSVNATGPTGNDFDGDGLANTLEEIVGTSMHKADSDNDGFHDAEELARQSNPVDRLNLPGSSPTSCGMAVYEASGNLRPAVAVYAASGDVRDADLAMGARVGQTLRGLPLSYFSKNSTIVQVPAAVAPGVVYVYDGTMNPNQVHLKGDLSIYATTVNVVGPVNTADAVNLASIDGVIVEQFLTSPPQPFLSFGMPTSGVYQPLGGSSGPPPPATWESGKICEQSMVVAGVNGPVVLQEVVAADCASGWSSYCGTDCTSSVGSTVEILDPLALIGG
jgi:hypothetical protein